MKRLYSMYTVLKQEGRAKRARMETVHGTIETPVFMNVGTAAAIKGAVSTVDLHEIKTQVELSNTYHLHVRPGDKVVKQLGGLHKFMNWDRPILTDSGGFQVFSLAKLRQIKEEGVYFHSHVDGRKIFMGPRRVCRSSPIWVLPLPWLLMNVPPARRIGSMWKIPWPGLPGGLCGVRRRWQD